MNGLFTSLWNGDGTAVADAHKAACRCTRGCRGRPGVPCQCSTVCRCQPRPFVAAALARSDMWAEAGEGELRGRPVVRGRVMSAGPAGALGAMRSFGGQESPGERLARWASPRSLAQAARQRQSRRLRLRRERQWLNHVFARRFGWGPYVPRIAALIGCGPCTPGSEAFLLAMMRWQRARGLVASGVLAPGLWRRLRPLVSGSGPSRAFAAMPTVADGDQNHGDALDADAQPHAATEQPGHFDAVPGHEPSGNALAPSDAEPEQPEWGWTGETAGW